jgi:hypothetical protein
MVDSCTWSSICRRLECSLSDITLPIERFADLRGFPYDEGKELNGILSYLTQVGMGNVHNKKVVNITSSGDMMNKCYQLADFGWSEWWGSSDVVDPWVRFDFQKREIWIESYTIRSHRGPSWMLQWELQGSSDGENWVTLDERNTNELASEWAVKTFECFEQKSPRFFRYIRLQNVGKNAAGRNHLVLGNIEFFGTLKE